MEKDFEIISSVRKIIRAVDVFSAKLKERFGLTSSQITCMEYILEQGPQAINSITKSLQLSPSMLTNIVDVLERQGYLERIRSLTDRRVILIACTDKGKMIMEQIPDSLNKKLLRNLALLSGDEKATITKSLHQIIQFIEAQELNSLPLITTGNQLIGELDANLNQEGNFKT